jgi:hypothetical protein
MPPLEALTVGLFLKQLFDQLEQAIESAKNAGLALEIQAGREINLAIQNASNALRDVLDQEIKTLDETLQGKLNELNTLVQSAVAQVSGDLALVTDKVQEIITSLPFRDHEPQLRSALPNFVVPSRNLYPALIKFEGNFEFASQADFAPTLEVLRDGAVVQSYSPSVSETLRLHFLAPIVDLFPPGSVDPKRFNYVIARLTVPWEEGLIFKDRHVSTYQIVIGALPSSPGQIKLQYNVYQDVQQTAKVKDGPHYQSSAADGANDDHKNVPWLATPNPGRHVVRGTSSFESLNPTEGEWSESFISDDADRVVYEVTTIHHGAFGTAGRVTFNINFTETWTEKKPRDHQESIDLKWGDSKVLPVSAGWRVFFDAFDGTHAEFDQTDSGNPFIKVNAQTNNVKIETADPKLLVWP